MPIPPFVGILRVKIKMWVNGAEGEELGGSTAKFGADLPTDAKDGLRNQNGACKALRSMVILYLPSLVQIVSVIVLQLSGSIALSPRGDCDFMTKAEVAQSGGAAELLVIHDKEDLLEMSCREKNIVNIKIPVVMIAKSGGEAINKSMTGGRKVEIMLYSPNRPIVDFSVVFLWLMAVGTESASADAEEEVLDISAKSAVVFVISASTFLVLLYLFMSSWFVWLLVAVFCLGGIEGMHACILSLVLRKGRNCGQKKVKLPLLGEMSVLSLAVVVFCFVFAFLWAINRKASYSWVGQDILGICLMIRVLQIARLPNIKVATVLLCCAFLYDIFWVFLSPYIFHDSVMIAVIMPNYFSFSQVVNPSLMVIDLMKLWHGVNFENRMTLCGLTFYSREAVMAVVGWWWGGGKDGGGGGDSRVVLVLGSSHSLEEEIGIPTYIRCTKHEKGNAKLEWAFHSSPLFRTKHALINVNSCL
ncbi:hypothetical protein TEA_005422 [Camellia sinensis var. sinensis]|uniref:PA domain-containing protein n=1 Tax=Camellia sinensis var. sinensis TaxID=542762 RepID=A0A4S4DIR3_CAMSN|nr:hypothetical protein TEA_005422 [Camellia sinensis var. sinensis]